MHDQVDIGSSLPPQAWKIYRALIVVLSVMMALVFFEPTVVRVRDGWWGRGEYVYTGTAGLDAHAVAAYAVTLLMLVTIGLGYRLVRGAAGGRVHRVFGRSLLLVMVPIFVVTSTWMVVQRGAVYPEQTVLFKQDSTVIMVAVLGLIGVLTAWFVRAGVAIRKGDVHTHVDSIVGAFVTLSSFALIRLLYVLVWLVVDTSPLSIMGMFFTTLGLSVGILVAAFATTRRLRANAGILATIVLSTLALAIIGAPHYQLLTRGVTE